MTRKFFTVASLGLTLLTGLVATGCSSTNSGQPTYGLTGTQSEYVANSHNPAYQDVKGHYRPELVGVNGR